MGTGRKFNNLSRVRPVKKARETRRRLKVQKKRLAALGVKDEVLVKLNSRQVKDLLQRPCKLKKSSQPAAIKTHKKK